MPSPDEPRSPKRPVPAWHPEAWGGAVLAFARTEAAGGLAITAAIGAAVVWANTSESTYRQVWGHPIHWPLLSASFIGDLTSLVNSGLMTIFFLAVGLEIGRERALGSLRGTRNAALPVVAALGGMAGAALAYLGVGLAAGAGGMVLRGWGVPMATDVAFTLGALALIGRRVPTSLRVFVLALAVADDIASVVVLAFVGSTHIHLVPLLGAMLVLAVVAVLHFKVSRAWWPYALAVIAEWVLLSRAGIEPTLAGAFVGMLVPCVATTRWRRFGPPAEATVAVASARIEAVVHPVSTFLVLPLFALANTGIVLGSRLWANGPARTVLVALVVARILGKVLGITLATLVVQRLRISGLPEGVRWAQLVGAAVLCGMGFTVPLLFAATAFAHSDLLLSATQLALLVASVLAFVLGAAILVRSSPDRRPSPERSLPGRHAARL